MADLFQTSNIRCTSTAEQIANAEASLKLTFPPSYRDFCLKYGLGMVGKLYMIYVPLENPEDPASVTSRVPLMKKRIETSKAEWLEDGMEIGSDVWEGIDDPGMVDRAVFFGTTENGDEIFWDVKGEGEFDIYVDCKWTIRFGGKNLDEFIRRCQTSEVKSIFGPGYEPLPSVFEGRDVPSPG